MWEWLASPIDATRAHEVGLAVSWHGRTMVLAWGVLAPMAIVVARFFKVLPGQNFPQELDRQFWWRSHWMGQSLVLGLTLLGLALIYTPARETSLHGGLGYAILGLCALQITSGLFRGTKGGPTAPTPDGSLRGDHYDMTPWRRMFETVHKSLGYATLALAAVTVLLGLWTANAPHWMWLSLALWWLCLAFVATSLQRRGWAIDTYQAIWGPSPEHPGNQRATVGWGMRRTIQEETTHVRHD